MARACLSVRELLDIFLGALLGFLVVALVIDLLNQPIGELVGQEYAGWEDFATLTIGSWARKLRKPGVSKPRGGYYGLSEGHCHALGHWKWEAQLRHTGGFDGGVSQPWLE